MVYLQASIKLKAGKLEEFVSMLNKLTPVLAKRGMKLLGSYGNVVGRLNIGDLARKLVGIQPALTVRRPARGVIGMFPMVLTQLL